MWLDLAEEEGDVIQRSCSHVKCWKYSKFLPLCGGTRRRRRKGADFYGEAERLRGPNSITGNNNHWQASGGAAVCSHCGDGTW